LFILGELLVLVPGTGVRGCGYDRLSWVYCGEEVMGGIRSNKFVTANTNLDKIRRGEAPPMEKEGTNVVH